MHANRPFIWSLFEVIVIIISEEMGKNGIPDLDIIDLNAIMLLPC